MSIAVVNEETEKYLHENLDILCCPKCRGLLSLVNGGLRCSACQQPYDVDSNIPLLFWPNEWDASKEDKTAVVKSFYEATPFPNYDDLDDLKALSEKAGQAMFPKLLADQLPMEARVLDCGCGTGQWSNFLSMEGRSVFGTDACINSLKLAQQFKEKHDLSTVHFLQMNLFRPIFRPASFDLVICNGVLHHTSDPYLGFKTIAKLVKPNGHIYGGTLS